MSCDEGVSSGEEGFMDMCGLSSEALADAGTDSDAQEEEEQLAADEDHRDLAAEEDHREVAMEDVLVRDRTPEAHREFRRRSPRTPASLRKRQRASRSTLTTAVLKARRGAATSSTTSSRNVQMRNLGLRGSNSKEPRRSRTTSSSRRRSAEIS